MAGENHGRPPTLRVVGRLLVAAALAVAIGWAFTHRDAIDAASLEARLAGLGPWAPLAFIAIYAAGTVLFLPGSVLTIAGGALFGPMLGALYSLIGATLGGTAAFLIARYLAANLVTRRGGPRLNQILDGVAARGWRFVAIVRLVPLLPFNGLNYVLGLTRVGLGAFVVTSFVCMVPGAVVYAYLGHASRELAFGHEGALKVALVAVSLLAALSLLPALLRGRREPQGPSPARAAALAGSTP